MKKQERIELTALWYGGGYSYQLQENNIGLYRIEHKDTKVVELKDYEIDKFWIAMDGINIWNWKKKYPYWKQEYEPLLDGCDWELKLRDKAGRVKYSKGYESFPRSYKYLLNELNQLFSAESEI